MKFFFVINSLSNKSGTERVACLLANLFSDICGYQVIIVNRDTDKKSVAYDLSEDVEVIKIDGSYYKFFKGLNKCIKEGHPDFIIVHNMGRLSILASFLSLNCAKIFSLEHVAFAKRSKLIRLFSMILYKKYNKVICLTENDKKDFEKIHPCVSVINNISPFDCEENSYSYNLESRNIIAIGRLTYQKNFSALLEAWKIIVDTIDIGDWYLRIYGKGEDFSTLQKIIKDYQLKNVALMGEVDNVLKVYLGASFYVMSSRFEGLPMVLIEAQSLGLPIISFDCPHGPRDIVEDNVNGFLVEDQDINGLAEKILELISNPDVRKDFSLCAYEHAQLYSKSQIFSKWLNIINE